MALITDFGHAPAHHPMFGFSIKHVVGRLTLDNWENKALLRMRQDELLYVMIQYGAEEWTGNSHYSVMVSSPNETRCDLSKKFPVLEAALAYANGDDGGDITTDTTPVGSEEYPEQEKAGVTVFAGR